VYTVTEYIVRNFCTLHPVTELLLYTHRLLNFCTFHTVLYCTQPIYCTRLLKTVHHHCHCAGLLKTLHISCTLHVVNVRYTASLYTSRCYCTLYTSASIQYEYTPCSFIVSPCTSPVLYTLLLCTVHVTIVHCTRYYCTLYIRVQ
jgi:hypothetical protein